MTRDEIKRVVGYVRVSTAEQGKSGLGLEAQRSAIRAECKRRGWQLVKLYQDTTSGKDLKNRPGLTEGALPALAAKRADALVIAKLDRLSRSVVDFGKVLQQSSEQSWALVALDFDLDTSRPTGKLAANVLMSVAEWERDAIVERTKAAMAEAKKQGKLIGRPKSITPEVAAVILRLRRQGLTFAAIAERLTRDGVPVPRGTRWWPSAVALVVRQAGIEPEPPKRPGKRRRTRKPA